MNFGAIASTSPHALARDCRIVLLSLPNTGEVKDVVLGQNGLVRGLSSGSSFDLRTTPYRTAQWTGRLKTPTLTLKVGGGI